MHSAEVVWDEFRFATQQPNETVEEWGTRVKRLRNKVQKYDIRISWSQCLKKWTVGTKPAYFTAQLREALCPADYRRDSVVSDLMSFEAWYQRFLQRQRERSRDMAEHSRLSTLQCLREKSKSSTPTRDATNQSVATHHYRTGRRSWWTGYGEVPPLLIRTTHCSDVRQGRMGSRSGSRECERKPGSGCYN